MNQKEKAEAIKRQLVIINKLLKKPENKYCADCKRTSPSWASINLGVFVCINCSGCHREIGVHVTKIKSVNLDVWAEDTLKYFQKINNEIANEYWEHKLKNFDFKSIQNDNYKLIKFIRDKYEYKKWVNKKKKDPMTLIMQGKFKNKKKVEESDEEENDEDKNENNESIDDNEEKEDNEENENEDDNKEEEFEEVQENDLKQNNNKANNNLHNQYTPPVQQINNIFVINNNIPNNNNQNKNILEDFNNNSNNNSSNLLDFNVQTEKDIKSQDLLSNIQNAYNDPNIDQNINDLNKMNNMIFNMNLNNKTPQFNLINNTGYNNNMYMNNNANNNLGNYKQNNNFNNINNKITTNNNEVKTKPNPMAFNLDYLNKNLSIKATNDKKKKDPFSDLVSLK
jgi:stromal membrane-associated protein